MNRTLVVLGSAPCLAADLVALGDVRADFMAVNRTGFRFLRPIKWWCSYHPDIWAREAWHDKRRAAGGNMDFTGVIHASCSRLESTADFPIEVSAGPQLTGSSTLFGVLFGLHAGYLNVVVAGAPLDHPDYAYFQDGWRVQTEVLRGRVSSVSGWTKKFLEGLNHGAAAH